MVGTETAQRKAETGMQTVSLAVILYNLEQVSLSSGLLHLFYNFLDTGWINPTLLLSSFNRILSDDSLSRVNHCPFYRFYVTVGTFGFNKFKGFDETPWYVFVEHLLCTRHHIRFLGYSSK